MEQGTFDKGNPSGLYPRGHAVLVEPYEPELDRARKGSNLIIPETVSDKTATLENRVRVVEVGPSAWSDEVGPRAAVGELVLVTRYAGFTAKGKDGKLYRLVNDRDIFCVIDPEV